MYAVSVRLSVVGVGVSRCFRIFQHVRACVTTDFDFVGVVLSCSVCVARWLLMVLSADRYSRLDSNPLVWTLTKPMKENPEFFQMSPGRDSSPCEIHAPCSAHEDPGMGEPLKDWRYTEAFLCDLTSAQESSTSRLSRRIEALEMAFADRRDQGQGLSVEVKDLQEQVQKTSELVYRVEMAHANLAQLVHGSQQKLDIIQRAHCSDVGALHERVQELRDLLEFDIGHGQGEKFPGMYWCVPSDISFLCL